MGPVRIAIVGMGGFARTYLRDIEQVEGLGRHVAQVAIEPDQRNFSTEVKALADKGVRVFASLRQMLAACRNEIDLLCIPTGIPLHRVMTVAGLEADCHVLVEKPAAVRYRTLTRCWRPRCGLGGSVPLVTSMRANETTNFRQALDLRG